MQSATSVSSDGMIDVVQGPEPFRFVGEQHIWIVVCSAGIGDIVFYRFARCHDDTVAVALLFSSFLLITRIGLCLH